MALEGMSSNSSDRNAWILVRDPEQARISERAFVEQTMNSFSPQYDVIQESSTRAQAKRLGCAEFAAAF
jgi:DNA primase large subunit